MQIAIGKSRKDTRWRNVEMTWEQFIARISEPQKTPETSSEWLSMSKDQRGEVKDIGGFVGGRLDSSGRRTKSSVINRCMVTLDLDYATTSAWDDIRVWGWTCAVYATHSYLPQKPRIRAVIPLDRTVTPDEYEAIARMVAKYIGIEMMDQTSYDPCRLMYWPSIPKDIDYYFRCQKGDTLSADEILADYGLDDAWKDCSLWPTSINEPVVRKKEQKKMGDPREKPGLVGAFCRVYGIREAIDTFLADVYEEGTNGSYDYIPGSGSNGLKIFDNTFAYSHHGTDPARGQDLNAFDLVRIHLFGDLDDETDFTTPITRRESYLKMCDLVSNDDEVKKLLYAERMEQAEARFSDLENLGTEAEVDGTKDNDADTTEDTKTDTSWVGKLKTNRKGGYEPSAENILTILNNDPKLKGKLKLDLFDSRVHIYGKLPWCNEKRAWKDSDDAALRIYFETMYNIESRGKIYDAFQCVTEKNAVHPVREYLNGLKWDGTERLDTMLIRFLAAEDTELTRTITRKWMVAAVKRIFEPGCKFDSMLVLVTNNQGVGKSMLCDTLGGEWYKDGTSDIEKKDARQEIQGRWIVEMGELSATRKADNRAIKQFISDRFDDYRASYGHYTERHPRQCVFIGTTNDKEFIIDETGGRRFWPVDVHAKMGDSTKRINEMRAERDQLWAEAVYRYKHGETVWLDGEVLQGMISEIQDKHSQRNEWQGMIETFLDNPLPDDWETMDRDDRRDYYLGRDLIRCDPKKKEQYTKLRQTISIPEIRYEMLSDDMRGGAGGNSPISREIARVMNVLDGWEMIGSRQTKTIWGRQKMWGRVGNDWKNPGLEYYADILEEWKKRERKEDTDAEDAE